MRWSWQGKRYQFSLGLIDESIGRAAAEMKAWQTERTTLLFRDYLLTQISPISAAEYFSAINAAWE
ncbi:MAG: hypothetical protein AAF579_18170 [Cyanobacteria bacterium P01_C01_bin.118]